MTPTGPGNWLDSLTGVRTVRGEVLFSFCPPDLLCSWGLPLTLPVMALDTVAATSPILLSKRYSMLCGCIEIYNFYFLSESLTYELIWATEDSKKKPGQGISYVLGMYILLLTCAWLGCSFRPLNRIIRNTIGDCWKW